MTIEELIVEHEPREPALDERLLERVRKIKGREKRRVKIVRPESELPELIVDVPDHWPYFQLAPLFDVHLGHRKHDTELFRKHWRWLRREPYTLTFDGGDFIENASKLSVGDGVYDQKQKADEQLASAVEVWASLWHKMLFKLPGNHEARTQVMGVSISAWLASMVEVPHFPDVVFCTLRYRGQNFRLFAHHGVGAATTAGAQRMAARKMLPWATGFDIFWTGHQHGPLLDVFSQTRFDQRTNRAFEADVFVIISPSYLKYFGSYPAAKLYPPGGRGMHVLRCQADGRIDASIHARGRRL